MFTIPLEKLNREDNIFAGNKASVLGELVKTKEFNVPKGFIIPSYVFDLFLSIYKIDHEIQKLRSLKELDEKNIKSISKKIKGLI